MTIFICFQQLAETKLKEEENLKKLAEVPHNVLYTTEAEGDVDSRELKATTAAMSQTELDRTTEVSKNVDVQAQLKVIKSQVYGGKSKAAPARFAISVKLVSVALLSLLA